MSAVVHVITTLGPTDGPGLVVDCVLDERATFFAAMGHAMDDAVLGAMGDNR